MHLSARTIQWPLYISSNHHVWVRGALDFVRKWVSLEHLEGRRVVLLLALL